VKFFSRLAPFLVALLIVGCAQNPAGSAYESRDGGFSVQMPGSVQEKTDANGTHMFIGQSANKDQAFIVSYTDFKNGKVTKANADQVLNNVRDGILQNGKNKLVSESKINVDGHPGRDIKLTTKDGYIMRDKVIITEGRMYQVLAVSANKEEANSPEVKKFFDSFHFTAH
jgi:hypothetical protein